MRISLYSRILGKSFTSLSPVLRKFHACEGVAQADGSMDVERPAGKFVALIAWLGGLPKPGREISARLTVTTIGDGERWERWFRERRLVSWQREWRGMLLESFGPWTVAFELVVDGGGISFSQRHVWWFGLPWLTRLGPQIIARIRPTDAGWNVDVRVALPLVGQIVHYYGNMQSR
ncbi:MAG: hypothetical protein JWM11_4958 [Planctomycetaceae bacterium]|nr:hypothetical protein [Planctomycetaceae bacterium]